MDVMGEVESLFPRLVEGDAGLVGVFSDRATVDSPLGGRQEPPEFVCETAAWLERHDARSEKTHTVVTAERVVHELLLRMRLGEAIVEVPVMLIADVQSDRIRDLRVYHSTWPLTGAHVIRHPLMDYTLAERPAEPVGTYHAALAAGDAASADAVFEADGSVREPAGAEFIHTGADRSAWYRMILSDGPLVLRLGTITDDGVTLVYEYSVDRWGSTRLPAQAGAAAYTRSPGGKLVSVRVYDDVDPPEKLAVAE